MPYKRELIIFGFLIGLVVVIAILSAKKFTRPDFSLEAPISNFNFFDAASIADAKTKYITTFDTDGNIVPVSLDDLYTQIQKTQNALMDKVDELVNAKLAWYVKLGSPVFMSVDGVGQLQTDGSKWMKATAGGNGQTITLFI